MTGALLWLVPTAFFASAAATALVRSLAVAKGLTDVPTSRSSHARPTPRGGGIAIVTATTLVLLVLWLQGAVSGRLALAAGLGGMAVAIVGFEDDRHSVPFNPRLVVHFSAAIFALWVLGGLPPVRVGGSVLALGWVGDCLAVAALVWALNLFNFMDGIDGIAAAQAIFMLLAGAWLAAAGASGLEVRWLAVPVAAATGGFLVWNWPPAKIFLGDVGSGYLGFVIAVLALDSARWNDVAIWIWLILGAAFFIDATLTLLRRLLRGASGVEPHREHAYQWLARRWGSHRRVTQSLLLINGCLLGPIAWAAARRPRTAAFLTLATLACMAVLCAALGAGRREIRNVTGEP